MNEIIVYEDEQKSKNIFLRENGEIVESYKETESHERIEGNIYARKSSKNITRNASGICRYWEK